MVCVCVCESCVLVFVCVCVSSVCEYGGGGTSVSMHGWPHARMQGCECPWNKCLHVRMRERTQACVQVWARAHVCGGEGEGVLVVWTACMCVCGILAYYSGPLLPANPQRLYHLVTSPNDRHHCSGLFKQSGTGRHDVL